MLLDFSSPYDAPLCSIWLFFEDWVSCKKGQKSTEIMCVLTWVWARAGGADKRTTHSGILVAGMLFCLAVSYTTHSIKVQCHHSWDVHSNTQSGRTQTHNVQFISSKNSDLPFKCIHTHTQTQGVRTPLLGGTRPLQSKPFHSGGLGISSINIAAGLLSSLLLELILTQWSERLPFYIWSMSNSQMARRPEVSCLIVQILVN